VAKGRRVPHMGMLLPDAPQRRYAHAQMAATVALVAAVLAPAQVAPIAALLVTLAAALLARNVLTVLRAFREARIATQDAPASAPQR